jgi:glucose-6-phosphate 1-dehydrogenase
VVDPGRPDPHVLVVLGATGDLARRKLFPALYRLYRLDLLPRGFRMVCSGRTAPNTTGEILETVRVAIERRHGPVDPQVWFGFSRWITFVAVSDDQGAALEKAVASAAAALGKSAQRCYYLAVPPAATESVVRMLRSFTVGRPSKIVLEKPFGRDLASARRLNAVLHEVVDERHIYRIDHFLGKEAVQNILAFRFANGLFEPVWNHRHVCYVQIDVPEEIDIQGRAEFMESTGTLRDMISTHLFQLLGFVAIEPPSRMDGDSLNHEMTKVFRAIRPLDPDRVVYGQYEGYREEPGVDRASVVETFVAMEVYIDDWTWIGVPFYLRTGKALAEGRRTITIGFREPPLKVFPGDVDDTCNELVLDLTDDPKIFADVRSKIPGPRFALGRARMRLDLLASFPGAEPLEAYERLLLDVLRGDPTLSITTEEIELLWRLFDPLLRHRPRPRSYPRHSWGPVEALRLPGSRGWRLPDSESGTRPVDP